MRYGERSQMMRECSRWELKTLLSGREMCSNWLMDWVIDTSGYGRLHVVGKGLHILSYQRHTCFYFIKKDVRGHKHVHTLYMQVVIVDNLAWLSLIHSTKALIERTRLITSLRVSNKLIESIHLIWV